MKAPWNHLDWKIRSGFLFVCLFLLPVRIRKPYNRWQKFFSSRDLFLFFYLSKFKLGGNYDSHFDVDKGTGTIIVAKPLDAEQKSNYNLTVEATDGSTAILTQVRESLLPDSAGEGWEGIRGAGSTGNSNGWFYPSEVLKSEVTRLTYFTQLHTRDYYLERKLTANPNLDFATCN